MAEQDRERARRALGEGPVSELELTEDDTRGLTPAARMNLSRKVAFLRAFCRHGVVLDGSRAAGVSRRTVSYWRTEDDWFDELFGAALEEAGDALELEAHRRAVHGVDEPVIYQGMPTMVEDADSGEKRILTVKRYSDALLTTLLKGNLPEKYRDNAKITHEVGQTGVLLVPGPIDPGAWAAAAAEQQAKFAGSQGDDEKA